MTETIGLTAIMDTKKFDRGVKLYYDGLAKMQSQTEKLVRGSVTVKDAEGNLVKFSTSTANAGAASQAASGAYSNTVTQLASLVAAYGVVTKIQDFAASSFTAARSQNDIKGALVNVVGGLDQYNALIKSAQQSTRGMVSETELAQAGMILLKSGIAENAEEVGRLSAAGTALVNTYTAQGATQEKLIRFILTGNKALLDNFNFTQQQINAKTAEIKVNEGLSGEEAKLAARKALVKEEGEKLLGSVSAETIAVGQLTAAWANFQADFGQLLILLNQGTGSLDSVTGAVQQLSAGATAWQSAIGNAQLLSQAYQRAGNETTLLDSYLAGLSNTFVPVVGLFNTLTMDTSALISVLNPAAGLIQNMTSAAGGWEASLLNISNAVIDATIGHEELAKAFSDIAGEQAAADAQLQIAEDAATAAAQVQAESDMVEESKAAFMGWGISIEGAAEAHNPLIRGMMEATAKAREEAKAIGELTLAQYSMENFKRNQQAQGLVGFAEHDPNTFSEWAAKKDEDRRIKAKQAEEDAQKELQRMQEKSARELARNFEKATQDMANTISSVLQPTLSEVWQPPEGAIPRIDEAARQLATVATSGFQSEWLGKLSEQFGNADFFQPIIQAMESGDPEALKGAATNLLTTGVENLWDVETIKAKVRESLQQQNLRQAIIDQVQAELSAEGLTVSPEQVTQIATGTTQAAAGATTAGQAVSTLGTDTATAQVAMDTFNSSLNNVSTIGIPTLITKAGELISALQGIPIGITSMIDQSTTAANDVANKLKDVINQSDWQNVGANIIKGTLKGIKENEAKVIEVLKAMARDAIDGVKDELGISSPSSEFAYIGQMMVSGLQRGINSSIPNLGKTYDQLFGGISRNIASTNNIIGSAADEVEEYLGHLEGSKADYLLERLKDLFRNNSKEILGATDRIEYFKRLALDSRNWGKAGIGNKDVEETAKLFIKQFDIAKKELEAIQQKVLIAGAQKAVQTATKLTELAQSAATQLNTEVDTLATLLNTGAGSFNIVSDPTN